MRSHQAPVRFLLWGTAASLGLFGALRLGWTETHLVLPLTLGQGALAVGLFGAPTLPVAVTAACSGAEALALCVGAVLAYPVRWQARLTGAAGGIVLILALNTIRIGTLGMAAHSAGWFNALHLYLWPAALTLAIAAYVFAWMRLAQPDAGAPTAIQPAPQPSRRFIAITAVLLIAFVAASRLAFESPLVLALGTFIARAAAAMLGVAGMSAHAAANVLSTSRGAFIVTQECIVTPLIPVYLAAVVAYATNWRWRVAGLLAVVPLFTALGIARLLVVALPATIIASPSFWVHAFYQLLLGAVVIVVAAAWRHGGKAAPAFALAGIVAGTLFVVFPGSAYAAIVSGAVGPSFDDPQGALAFLPAFQIGLYLALCVAGLLAAHLAPGLLGLGLLALVQTAGLAGLHALAAAGLVQVRDVRAFAVAAPVLVFALVVRHVRATP